ncbi:MAG: cupin domain-containing protein [Caldilineaceae bacterium]|nr:cupin domain-containing protein [Caldilineaceae bacterium]
MVKSGDVLEHPVTGEKIVFRKTARETSGELLQADLYMQPGAFVAAEHIHPLQEERFKVIMGTLHGRVAGKELSSSPGETIVVPKGTPHVWWNAGDDELQVSVEVRPALKLEHFFEVFFGLAQAGKVNPKTGLPNPFQLALIMHTYRNELVLAQLPRVVQTLLFGTLAPIAKLLGYHAEYPYPHVK